MKKWMSLLLALVMLLCVACGDTDKGSQSAPTGVYYEVTGIDPRATALTVDGNEIPMELYCYWIAYNCSGLEYNLGMANMYSGLYSELFNEDGTMKWASELEPGLTIAQLIKDKSDANARFYATVENMAKEYGIVLTEEDTAAMAADKAAATEELGGQEAFQQYLDQLGISEANFDRLASVNHLFDGLNTLVLQEGSELYLEDAGYDEYATYADHILLATVDLTTQEPLSEEEVAAKRATAEDLLAQLKAADDVYALFAQLADEYSEDTGRATNPNGYIYVPGTMVTEFEDAAAALEPGQVSDIVETTYGYHIILRKDLAQGMAEDPDEKVALAAQHLSALIQEKGEAAEVVVSEDVNAIDVATFYPAYVALVDEKFAELQPDEEVPAEGETEAEGEETPAE